MSTTDQGQADAAAAAANDPSTDRISTAQLTAGVIVLALLIVAVTGLLIDGRDPGQLLYFAGGSILPFAALILFGKRLDALRSTATANRSDLKGIGTAVNGQLTAQFAELHQRLTLAGIPTTPALAPPAVSGAAVAAQLAAPAPGAHEALPTPAEPPAGGQTP